MTYEDIFRKYFTERENYYSMFSLYYRSLELYLEVLILTRAFERGSQNKVNPYNYLEKYIGIYSDSYMIKARQLYTTSTRENSLVYRFFNDVLQIDNRQYFKRDRDWLQNNYVGGVIDKYQKLEIHSNSHIKYYRIHHKTVHDDVWTSFYRTPLSFNYPARTAPYIKCLARAIYNFRRKSGIHDVGYEPLQLNDFLREMSKLFRVQLAQDDILQIDKKTDEVNNLLFSLFE